LLLGDLAGLNIFKSLASIFYCLNNLCFSFSDDFAISFNFAFSGLGHLQHSVFKDFSRIFGFGPQILKLGVKFFESQHLCLDEILLFLEEVVSQQLLSDKPFSLEVNSLRHIQVIHILADFA
jgi:hypothetical protein